MAKEIPLMKAQDISVRVQSVYGSGNSAKAVLLLYKNARVDMAILDEVFGAENWSRDHKELKGVLYCGVSINYGTDDAPRWVTKWDAGTESNTEAEKGEASDSFKRACVNHGIGRELYTSPGIVVELAKGEYETSTFNNKTTYKAKWFFPKVQEIEYNENREISRLVIVDSKGDVRYTYPKGYAPTTTSNAPTGGAATAPATAPTTAQNGQKKTEGADINVAKEYLYGNARACEYFLKEHNSIRAEHGQEPYATIDCFNEFEWMSIYAKLKKGGKI